MWKNYLWLCRLSFFASAASRPVQQFEDLSCSAFYIQLCNAVFVEFDSTIDFNLLEKNLDTGKNLISEYAQ